MVSEGDYYNSVCQQSMILGLNFSCISFTEVYSTKISVKYSYHQKECNIPTY